VKVMKFGGTSVGDGERIRGVARILKEARQEEPELVVVVSAMSGVTDALIQAAQVASRREVDASRKIIDSLLAKHLKALEEVVGEGSRRRDLEGEIRGLLGGLEELCQGISILGELTPRGLDAVRSLGERLSVRLLAGAMNDMGLPAVAIDATELIITDDNFTEAAPLMAETRERVRARIVPLLGQNLTPVVTGFIGATRDGLTTTLGRGSSDYSASILGNSLDCDEIWIWSDVDGVMTADPRVVKEARTIGEISYREMAELSYFGAKVVHPRAVLPAAEKRIPLWIKNTFNPAHPGTLVVEEPIQKADAVKGITSIKGVTLVTVEGRGMMGVPGVAARLFAAVAQEGVSVMMISQSSSELNICFLVPEAAAQRTVRALERAFERELARRDIERIAAQDDVAIIAIVGAGMRGTPGIAGKVFSALGRNRVNVIAIAQGSSEYNISFVVKEEEMERAVNYIHQEFGLGG